MLRILPILAVFSMAIAGLVYLQTMLLGPDALETASAGAPARTPATLTLTDVTDVSAELPLAGAAPSITAATDAAAGSDAMANLTASVLAGLGQPGTPAQPAALNDGSDEMLALTSAVLAGLGPAGSGGARGSGSDAPTPDKLTWLISRSLSEGKNDAYIDLLVNEAADAGIVNVPNALRTSDGRVDTGTLIREIARSEAGAPALPDEIVVGGPGVEVRVVREAGGTIQHHFYTVQEGDSLGAIAQSFYGDAALYRKIFQANRRILSSPNLIRAGQRLTIPG